MDIVTRELIGERDWQWVNEQVGILQSEDTQGIVAIDTEGDYTKVAACVLDNLTSNSVQAHFMLTTPMVLRHKFLERCFDHVFNKLGKKVMYGLVPSNNVKALRLNAKMGFTEAFRLKEAYADGIDYVGMELTKENCKYL